MDNKNFLNKNHRKLLFLTSIAFLPLFSGCTQTYLYATGEKGNAMGRRDIHAFAEVSRMFEADGVTINEDLDELGRKFQELDKKINPDGVDDVYEALKNWDSLSGVHIEFKRGSKKELIFEKFGKPVEIKPDPKKKYYETWEYDCCTMVFRKNKLKEFYTKD